MSLESDLMQPDRQGEDTPPPAVEETPAPVASAPLDEEAALDKLIEEQSIALPDGEEKLVPLSALTTVRGKLSEAKKELGTAKEGSAKAQALEEKVNQLQATINQWQPYVQAYNAALTQQQHQQPAVEEDTTELQELAKDLDFYKPDGNLDIDKARRFQARIDKQAGRQADQRVAPIIQQSTTQQSATNRERAKATVFPTGEKADPEMVDMVWNSLDPALTATEKGAKFAALQALGMSRGLKAGSAHPVGAVRGPDGKFVAAAAPVEPPLYVEKAGGKDPASGQRALDDTDRKAMKAIGMTEQEYLDAAKSMPKAR